ncbi:hypothetical protein CRENBAI_008131 [Crenichthys baileyi]|uniref:Uncharacterized protein n=1 Tax=Crenichthys baileyi TaxID=28760 RepID=A0AAV9R6I0_9TELE
MADANASNGNSDAAASSSSILNAIIELKEEFTLRFDGLFSAIKGIQGGYPKCLVNISFHDPYRLKERTESAEPASMMLRQGAALELVPE